MDESERPPSSTGSRVAHLKKVIEDAERELRGLEGEESRVRAAEELLRDSEEAQRRLAVHLAHETRRLHDSQSVASVGSWETDLSTRDVIWTPETFRIFELEPGTFQPTHARFLELVHPEDRGRVGDAFEASIGRTGVFSIEHRVLLPGGRLKFLEERWRTYMDASGVPQRAVGTCQDITERRLAMETLSQREELLRIAGTIAHLGGWSVDFPGPRITWSDEVCAIHEMPPGTVPSLEQALAFYTPESYAILEPAFRKCARDGTPYDLELQILTASGQRRWVRAIGQARRDATGAIHRVQGAFQDITDRKAAEAELQRVADTLQKLVRIQQEVAASNLGLQGLMDLISDRAWNLTGAAGAALELTEGDELVYRSAAGSLADKIGLRLGRDNSLSGLSRTSGSVLRCDDTELDPRVDRDATRRIGARSMLLAPVRVGDANFGVLKVVSGRPAAFTDRDGHTLQILVETMSIVLERQRFDARIREQAALLDEAQDAIIVRDLAHRITYWNKSAEKLYGWSSEEALGRSLGGLLFPDSATFEVPHAQVLENGEWFGELTHVTKDGRPLTIQGRWTLVRDEAGQPRAILAIHTDLTERKRLEQQYLRGQRLESVGTLAGGIAHDLNNALHPIMMASELLRDLYPGESSVLEMIETSTRRGAEMVRQLLAFAKGAKGERVVLQPGRIIRDMEVLIRGTFPKNVELVVSYQPDPPKVLGDATQLHQLLMNLCVNARDAMPTGGTLTIEELRVEVDAAYASSIPGARPGSYAALRVRDTGTGISREALDRIFDPFFTTKGPDKGTGLGLSNVLGIAKGHGGFVQVYSQLGKGSTFTVYLPLDGEASVATVSPKASTEFRGRGETVLLVDDEEAVREMAHTVLRRLNLTPVTASDGADGLMQAALHRTELRVVVTDLHMPNMDGLAFTRALRRLLPHIPVVVASGMMEDATASELERLGLTSRLDKPFTQAQLAAALEPLLRRE